MQYSGSVGMDGTGLSVSDDAFAIDPKQDFSRCYERYSFRFFHGLVRHPLFQLPSLLELARRQGDRPGFAFWSAGTVNVHDSWYTGYATRPSLLETIKNVSKNDSLTVLKHVELDTVFGPVMNDLLLHMVQLSGPLMRADVVIGRATILIASPRRITTYHIDSDTNFLFQIVGDKTISVFDRADRTLVTHRELENYYAGDVSGAIFKSARQNDATVYDLRAGTGIHIPSGAPHWAQNGKDVSVALSLNFDLRSVLRSGRIYKLNNKLRRFGIEPTPPGVSAWRDEAKLAAAKTAGAVRRFMGGAAPSPLGWKLPHGQDVD
jgi:hypothetical protein